MADTHDVRMPDGTIVRGVPVGTTKAQILAKLNGGAKRTNLGQGTFAIDRGDRLGPEIHNKLGVADLFAHNYSAGLDVPATGLADVLANAVRAPFSDKVDFRPREVFQRAQRARMEDINTARTAHSYASIPAEVVGAVTSAPGRAGSAALGALGRMRGGIGSLASGVSDLASRAGPLARSTLDAIGWGGLMGASEGQGGVKGGAEAAAGNIAGNLAFRGAGRVVSPLLARTNAQLAATGRQLTPRQEQVRLLHEIGTQLTPGQISGGPMRWVEDSLGFIPGSPQKMALRRSMESTNVGAINNALEPIGVTIPRKVKTAHAAARFAQDASSRSYSDSLDAMTSPLDTQFHADLGAAQGQAARLPGDLADTYNSVIALHVNPFLTGDVVQGRNLQSIKRGLDDQIAAYERSPQPRDGLLVGTLDRPGPLRLARDAFMSNAERNVPDLYAQYRKADAAYRNMVPINEAIAKSRAPGGAMSPLAFSGAVRKRGFGTTTRNLARGEANMQQIADAQASILPPEIKSSGTAERGLAMAILGGSGLSSVIAPHTALIAAPLTLPYLPGVRGAYQAYRLGQRGPIAEGLTNRLQLAAPYAGSVGGALAVQGGGR